MTPRINRLALLLLLALATGCSTVQVNTDFGPATDFSALQTYDWMPGPQRATGGPRLDNEILEKRIRMVVDKQLAARGTEDSPRARPISGSRTTSR